MSRFALVGDPVDRSLAPVMHAAAYRKLGLPHTYQALRTTAAELPARFEALRRADFGGLDVAAPHGRRALELAEDVDEVAAQAGLATTLVLRRGRVLAFQTDAPAVAERIATFFSGAPPRERALVLGAGRAARAALVALVGLGVRDVAVRARRFAPDFPDRAKQEPLRADPELDRKTAIVVQATSAGMRGADRGDEVARAVDWGALPPKAVALEMIYTPLETPFLAAARAKGLRCEGGLDVLVAGAALSLELWTGLVAPRETMRAAAREKLA